MAGGIVQKRRRYVGSSSDGEDENVSTGDVHSTTQAIVVAKSSNQPRKISIRIKSINNNIIKEQKSNGDKANANGISTMKEASTHRNQMTNQKEEEEPYGSCTSKNKVSTSQTNIVGSRAEGSANNGNQREEHLGQNSSLNLTGMDEMLDDNSCDLNEIGSSLSSTLVAVNGYKVKPEWASLLNAIFLRHGDIAKDCSFVGIRSRSSLLEIVCEIIQKLEDTEFIHIKAVDLKSMLDHVRDVESVKLEVGWLHQRLDDISEAIDLCKGYPRLTNAQKRRTEVIEKKKEELKSFNMEILDSEGQILALQNKILTLKKKVLLAEDELTPMKVEAEKIAGTISETMAKVKRFHQKSLVDGLL